MRRIFKIATGGEVPEGAIYLLTLKNGKMEFGSDKEFVWHYFLVECDSEGAVSTGENKHGKTK